MQHARTHRTRGTVVECARLLQLRSRGRFGPQTGVRSQWRSAPPGDIACCGHTRHWRTRPRTQRTPCGAAKCRGGGTRKDGGMACVCGRGGVAPAESGCAVPRDARARPRPVPPPHGLAPPPPLTSHPSYNPSRGSPSHACVKGNAASCTKTTGPPTTPIQSSYLAGAGPPPAAAAAPAAVAAAPGAGLRQQRPASGVPPPAGAGCLRTPVGDAANEQRQAQCTRRETHMTIPATKPMSDGPPKTTRSNQRGSSANQTHRGLGLGGFCLLPPALLLSGRRPSCSLLGGQPLALGCSSCGSSLGCLLLRGAGCGTPRTAGYSSPHTHAHGNTHSRAQIGTLHMHPHEHIQCIPLLCAGVANGEGVGKGLPDHRK